MANAQSQPAPQNAAPPEYKRKIKIGIIGQGVRGSWIAQLFLKHGGYEIHALADYFPDVIQKAGETLNVDPSRRFSGLSGYKKLLDSGVEAVVDEAIPYFFPEHARAAVDAGRHVYMAKPIAPDVPGCLAVGAAGKQATEKKLCFLVDYQLPTDPCNIEVKKRIDEGGVGKISRIATFGVCAGHDDPPKTANLESRMQKLIWDNDKALSGGYIMAFDIHALDAAVWVCGQRPLAAMGASWISRPNPSGDAHDGTSLVYEYANGVIHSHFGQALRNSTDGGLRCSVYGPIANALLSYDGKVYVRSGPKHYVGEVVSPYNRGAERNIAEFYRNIVEGRCENATVPRAVDGALTAILGREAAERRTRLTMEDLLKENRKLEVDLTGLKA